MGRKRVLKFATSAAPPLGPGDMPAVVTADPEAAAEWQRVIASVEPGHLIACDMAILSAYVLAMARLRRLERDAAQVEPVITAPSSGYKMPHPLLALLSKQTILVSKPAAALALTPLTRDRVARMPPDRVPGPGDEFTAFQRQRRRPRP